MQAHDRNRKVLLRSPAAALALQQLLLIAGLGSLMALAQALTGRTLRGLADAPSPGDLALYAASVAALVFISRRIARARSPGVPLGLGLTRARARSAGLGFGLGALANALPWASALLLGDATITARVELASGRGLAPIALGLGLAWANAWFEEATSRAAPLTILRPWAPWRAVAVSALCFGLMHGIGETLAPLRLAYLAALGVLLGAAYVGCGHVWWGAGLHAGWFWASLLPSGRFHGGALLALEGNVSAYVLTSDLLLMAAALGVLIHLARRPAPLRGGATAGAQPPI